MTIKQCSRCGEHKLFCAFGKNAKRPDGLQDHCKVCRAAHYAANAERLKADSATYYAANAEKVAQRKAEYREANRDRLKEQNRKAWAEFRAAFVGPRWPHGLRRDRASSAGRPERPRSPAHPKSPKTLRPPPARPLTPEEVAEAQRLLAKFEAERRAAAPVAAPSGSYRKSSFHRIADAEQARADGMGLSPASGVTDDLAARRAAALEAAASLAASLAPPRPLGRVAFVPPSRT
jgi:hypothetical protein